MVLHPQQHSRPDSSELSDKPPQRRFVEMKRPEIHIEQNFPKRYLTKVLIFSSNVAFLNTVNTLCLCSFCCCVTLLLLFVVFQSCQGGASGAVVCM